jgi:GxxExxY protein
MNLNENNVAKTIVEIAFDLHREVGPGLLESVYEAIFASMLREQGLGVERQKPIPIRFRSMSFDEGFRADLVVNQIVLVELKSISVLAPVHRKQVLTYLRLSDLRLGLLISFGGELLKGNIERLVNQLDENCL